MIKRSKILVAALMLCVFGVVYTSCKSDDDSNPPKNVLCDGNGELSYFPLDSGNTWGYQYLIMDVNQSQINPILVINGTITYLNKRYFILEDIHDQGFYGEETFLREDVASHNIYRFTTNTNQEYIEVPGSPTLNQSWTYVDNSTRKVTNLSASKVTPSCSYTGLLEITQTSSSGNYVELFYYKKGLGIVYKTSQGLMASQFKLKSGVIK